MNPLVAASVLVTAFTASQTPEATSMSAGQLAHELDRLAHAGRVLYIAAHPDDENTRLLTYLANARHLQVAYLSLTRGGGGQNLIGQEQGELLDAIRTEELLAARRTDGASQRFTRMRDFGYSKSADEAFSIWDREEALADVVWVLRTFQPDVIITRFNEEPPNHGHHTASAILAREAFAAASDPKRFPEQLTRGATVWKGERVMHNLSHWRTQTIPPDAIELDVGAYDPRLGLSYGEIAALSRSQHKSQGFGASGERGPLIERFVWVAGSKPQKNLLEGVDIGWGRFGEAAGPYVAALERARRTLEQDRPELALPALVDAHRALDALPDVPRVRDARRHLEQVIAAAAGLFLRATAERPGAVPGDQVKVELELVMRRPVPMKLAGVTFPGQPPQAIDAALGLNEKRLLPATITVPADAPISTPYWLADPPLRGRFQVRDPALIGAPNGPPALQATVELSLYERTFRFSAPLVHAWTDRVHGERVRRFQIVPPATVTPARQAVMFPNGKSAPVVLRVRAGRDALKGSVRPGVPAGWKVTPKEIPVSLAKAGDEITVRFDVQPPRKAQPIEVRPEFVADGRSWSFREDVIDYPHIPVLQVLQQARLRLVPLEITLPSGLIGYIPGPGDTVAEDLAHVGARVEVLDEETIRSGDLRRFSAIVVGIRAYNTREVLRSAHARLMRFVEQGGTVLVQFNTNSRWSPLDVPVGPYPLEIGRARITDETATMTPVDPKHPALHRPNRITAADFEGWVQERGVYFAVKWDERYQPLFSAADPGEDPLLGGALVARHGRGRYVYTGLAFFRQLPAGVPGAYRLLANLISGK